MPRTEEVNQQIREQQWTNILTGARHVFARKGWAATMADIAREAAVSQGLAYRYFSSKEAIYTELVRMAREQRASELKGSARERLEALLSVVLEPGSPAMEFYQVCMQILLDQSFPDSLRPELQAVATTFRGMLKDWIIEGQRDGDIVQGDPEQLAVAVFAAINGLTLLGVRGHEQVRKHFPDVRMVLRLLDPK